MAITPLEAIKLTKEEKIQLKKFEEIIDNGIKKRFQDYDSRAIIDLPNGLNYKLRKEIEKIYDNAGWSVNYVSDQRDGDYLEFKPKNKGVLR
jgi:hypothetical protein